MRLPWRRRSAEPRTTRRSFVTPEGVDLRLELGARGARAGAFLLDATIMLVLLIAITAAVAWLAHPSTAEEPSSENNEPPAAAPSRRTGSPPPTRFPEPLT